MKVLYSFRFLLLFTILFSCNLKFNLEMQESLKNGNWNENIDHFYEKESSYKMLPKKNVESAIKVQKQGGYGSCVIDSLTRSIVLTGSRLKNGHKNLHNDAISYINFNEDFEFKLKDLFKKKIVNSNENNSDYLLVDNIKKAFFDSGVDMSNIGILNNILFKNTSPRPIYEIKSIDPYSLFDKIAKIILNSICENLPLIASFFYGISDTGKKERHTMNIIGVNLNKSQKITHFVVLNTWDLNSNFLGVFTYNQMKACMKIDNNRFRIIRLSKKKISDIGYGVNVNIRCEKCSENIDINLGIDSNLYDKYGSNNKNEFIIGNIIGHIFCPLCKNRINPKFVRTFGVYGYRFKIYRISVEGVLYSEQLDATNNYCLLICMIMRVIFCGQML